MDKYKNYYKILGIDRNANSKAIKIAYYKISMDSHPDKGGDEDIFKEITEAYKILSNIDKKSEYDIKSKYGKDYDEISELLDFEFNNDAKNYDKNAYEKWKDREQLNIIKYFDENFDGKIEYERYVLCKPCEGTGKDNSSRIMIKNSKGEVKYFDALDGCDFCEGSGKWGDLDCLYCFGAGKIGTKECSSCKGEKRILGKQKLTGIKINPNNTEHKVEFMGHISRDIPGKVGDLWLIKKQ